jgi:predicted outer membrane repeat protein
MADRAHVREASRFNDRPLLVLARAASLFLFAAASIAQATTWTVNNTGDPASGTAANCAGGNANTCTVRDALAASTDGDTIAFAVDSNQTITLTSNTQLEVDHGITIDGSGSPGLTIDGNNTTRVFYLNAPSQSVTMQDLAIAHGNAMNQSGGGIYTASLMLTLKRVTLSENNALNGGGIYGDNLALEECTVQGNHALSEAGGIDGFVDTLTLSRTTISGNSTQGSGGALVNRAIQFTVENSTIYGNTATNYGGIANYVGGAATSLSLTNTTFLSNAAASFGKGFNVLIGSINLTANNNAFGDGCVLGVPINGSNNLDAGTSCGLPAGSSNIDLHLGPLQDNGGPTATVKPDPDSPAIDSGNDSVCAGAAIGGVDQRGIARPQGLHCDIGAVEVARTICYVKADAVSHHASDGTSWTNAYTDLQTALTDATCDEIWVARGVYKPTAGSNRAISFIIRPVLAVYGGFAGVGSLRDAAAYRTVLSGDIDNNDSGTNGIDTDTTQIAGNNSYHVVVIDGTTVLGPVGVGTILDGFTITGGKADDASGAGGGVFCNGNGGTCSPTLRNLVFSGNLAVGHGGALYAGGEGGVSSPTITNSTFRGNSAADGGAIYDDGAGGTSSPTIANVTFADNAATDCGGGIYDDATAFGTSSPAIRNSTFAGNTGIAGGGGSALCDFTASGTNATKMTNVIVWGNETPELESYSGGATLDHVILQENACPTGMTCTPLIGANPNLGPLQDNGGVTPTLMIGAGSSAIDAGLDSACAAAPVGAVDQRGLPRPQGAHCDIGAVEATNLSLTLSDGKSFGFYGTTLQYVVTLQNKSATDTVSGVRVDSFGTDALDAPDTLWFCTIGTCTTTQQAGPLGDSATLPPNSSLTWLVNVPVFEDSIETSATMSVRSTGAAAVSDTDTLAIFRGTFENP